MWTYPEDIGTYMGSPKNTADQDSRYKNLALSTKQKQCMKVLRLKFILLLQESSHDFEPTFIIFCLI